MARQSLAAPIPSKSEQDYQAESDHSTLQRAGEVMGDPARLKRVAAHHRKMSQNIASVAAMMSGPEEPKSSRPTPVKKRKSPRPYTTKRGISRR